jgi:hypothetical protein
MNPDSYHFLMLCKECNENRSVSGSRADICSGRPVQVYAIACDHAWTLSPEGAEQLRQKMPALTYRYKIIS